MSQEEIHIWTPLQEHELSDGDITFTINYMKCRTISVIYYKLHCYDYNEHEILIENKPFHIGERWVVDETWSSYHDTFNITSTELEEIYKIRLELILINVGDNNPLYLTELMLQNGLFEEFHEPKESIVEAEIGFINNAYANLYNNDNDNYLQIIRPNRTPFTTLKLTKDNWTVLAPHITGENPIDKPENLFVEFINQTEQEITIKPVS